MALKLVQLFDIWTYLFKRTSTIRSTKSDRILNQVYYLVTNYSKERIVQTFHSNSGTGLYEKLQNNILIESSNLPGNSDLELDKNFQSAYFICDRLAAFILDREIWKMIGHIGGLWDIWEIYEIWEINRTPLLQQQCIHVLCLWMK